MNYPNGTIYETARYDYWVRPGQFGNMLHYHDNQNANSPVWSQPLLLDPNSTVNLIPGTNQFTARISENPMNGAFAGQTIVSEACLSRPKEMTTAEASWIQAKHEAQIFNRERYKEMTAGKPWEPDNLHFVSTNLPSDILAKKERKGIDLGFDNPSNEDQYGQ